MGRMTRRNFLCGIAASAAAGCAHRVPFASARDVGWSFDAHDGLRISCPGIGRPVRLWVLADTHLAMRDARDAAFDGQTARMFQWPGDPHCLSLVLKRAKAEGVDRLLLAGDNISFPTLANVEFLKRELDSCGVPWSYVAGNHDWHFEGDGGSDFEQRARWIERRLRPLYGGADPLASSVSVGGVRIVLIDNSLYHVTPGQLAFWRAEIAKGDPTLLVMHIPFWQPGWSVATCACPTWGAATDPYWEIERRARWAERLMPSTFEFRDAVVSAPNLIGVVAGHIHHHQVAEANGRPMVTAPANGKGDILPVLIAG